MVSDLFCFFVLALALFAHKPSLNSKCRAIMIEMIARSNVLHDSLNAPDKVLQQCVLNSHSIFAVLYFMAAFILCDILYSLKFSSPLCCQSLLVHINLPRLCECDSHLTLICPIRKTLWKVK